MTNFTIDSMASLHAAVARTQSLPIMEDIGVEERVLISTVVSELGTNILKFAQRGRISINRIDDAGHDAIQVIARDKGAGIHDVESAIQEGYSTAGTLGLGLSAVRRIMSSMNIETGVGKGTTVTSIKWLDGCISEQHKRVTGYTQTTDTSRFIKIEHAHVNRPHPHEKQSGDSLIIRPTDIGLLFGIIDVSGHGAEAHALTKKLSEAVQNAPSEDLDALLHMLHDMAKGTRGAAAGLALLNRASGRLSFAGIGNVHIRTISLRNWRGVSRDGILGERMRNILPQSTAITSGDIIMLASDGVSESAPCRFLVRGSPLKAKHLVDKVMHASAKMTDDASCVVIKCL
ncbi:SpoIIE family protein phosphatase [Magnetococcus sp. PR-3]|uniref:SpoIIE family protein phosphatase n=1 Tax=Magnetococcus sp. PR-3 TaxID=3120355 RepID=UPI002FCE26F7